MKKYISKIKRLSGLLAFTVVFLNSTPTFAQHNAPIEQNVLVPYNTAFSYDLANSTSWELTTSTGQVLKNGTGSIENEVFNEPGNYVLQIHAIHNPNSCDDSTPEKLNIKATAMKMEFDFSTVKFSKNIKGGQSVKGIVVSINAMYSSYENSVVTYTNGFKTAGVGTSIFGKLKNGQLTLQQGVNTLEFVLDGQATTGNYIMFDFVDINGDVQSYGLTQIIQ